RPPAHIGAITPTHFRTQLRMADEPAWSGIPARRGSSGQRRLSARHAPARAFSAVASPSDIDAGKPVSRAGAAVRPVLLAALPDVDFATRPTAPQGQPAARKHLRWSVASGNRSAKRRTGRPRPLTRRTHLPLARSADPTTPNAAQPLARTAHAAVPAARCDRKRSTPRRTAPTRLARDRKHADAR